MLDRAPPSRQINGLTRERSANWHPIGTGRSAERLLHDRGRAVVWLEQVTVDAERDRRRAVPEPTAQREHVEPVRDQDRGAGMAQAVKRHREPRRLHGLTP